METRTQRLVAVCTWGLALVLTACSNETHRPIFALQINARDVVIYAVHRMQLVLQPADSGGNPDLDKRFQDTPERRYEDGAITARVTSAGEFQIIMDGEWVAANRTEPPSAVFAIELPIYSTSEENESGIFTVHATASIERDRESGGATITETIAEGRRLIPWPLQETAEGEPGVLNVECKRSSLNPADDFSAQCSNTNPAGSGP